MSRRLLTFGETQDRVGLSRSHLSRLVSAGSFPVPVEVAPRRVAFVEAEVEARQRMVPSFLLQPLIENAVKHGLQEERCELRIWAGCDGDMLTVTVSNPGRLPENLEVVEGVGLETLRRRLEFHYPGRALFELSQMDGIVTAELQLRGEPCSA